MVRRAPTLMSEPNAPALEAPVTRASRSARASVRGAGVVAGQGRQEPGAGARVARRRDVLARRGPREQVALAETHPLLDQPGALALRLDALGHERDPDALGEELDRPQQVLVLQRGADAAREAGVELEERDRQAVERGQRGVATAEVVEGDAHPRLAQAPQDARARLEVVQRRALRDLEHQ